MHYTLNVNKCITFALILALPAFAQESNLDVKSTLDGTMQPNYFVEAEGDAPRPLLVSLHSWSNGFNTDTGDGMRSWERAAKARNWHLLQPHFRGPNKTPEGCGSELARQDILDAVDAVMTQYKVDPSRIYLAGASGGGHMAMVMAAHAPERWTAVSAWVGISDLAAWYRECKESDHRYWEHLDAAIGGAPGTSDEIDTAYHYRSPVHHLAAAKDVPLDISVGIHDGHSGSVPIHHSLDAFNVIAKARGDAEIPAAEIDRLSKREGLKENLPLDPAYGRGLHLQQQSGPCRITVFEGGHEGLPETACVFLGTHIKAINNPR